MSFLQVTTAQNFTSTEYYEKAYTYVRGYDEGQWRSKGRNGESLSTDDPAPHEVGHILGLPVQYTDER